MKVLALRGAGGRAFAAGNEISDFLSRHAVACPIAKTLGNALADPIVHRCAAVFGSSAAPRP